MIEPPPQLRRAASSSAPRLYLFCQLPLHDECRYPRLHRRRSGQAVTHFEYRKRTGGSVLAPTIDDTAPISHMRKDCPPYIIISGDRELELLGRYEENAYMWRMMNIIGHPKCLLYELDGFSHGGMAEPAFYILRDYVRADR